MGCWTCLTMWQLVMCWCPGRMGRIYATRYWKIVSWGIQRIQFIRSLDRCWSVLLLLLLLYHGSGGNNKIQRLGLRCNIRLLQIRSWWLTILMSDSYIALHLLDTESTPSKFQQEKRKGIEECGVSSALCRSSSSNSDAIFNCTRGIYNRINCTSSVTILGIISPAKTQ